MAQLTASINQQSLTPAKGYDYQWKTVPKNIDGTIKDMTTFNAGTATLPLYATSDALGPLVTTITPTVVSGDATGITLKMTAADMNTIVNNFRFNGSRGFYTLTVSNGTDTVRAAVGAFTMTMTNL